MILKIVFPNYIPKQKKTKPAIPAITNTRPTIIDISRKKETVILMVIIENSLKKTINKSDIATLLGLEGVSSILCIELRLINE
jgi:hypothetical protein